jgi:hypothetical protein
MNSLRLRLAAVLLIGFMGLTAACGGSSSDSGASSTTQSSGSGGDAEDLGGALDSLTGDCAKAGAAYFSLSLSAAAAAMGVSDADKAQIENELANLTADIPDEIKKDFAVYSEALRKYVEAMKGLSLGDLMDSGVQSRATEAAKLLETPEVKEAQANIEGYFNTRCPSLSGGS